MGFLFKTLSQIFKVTISTTQKHILHFKTAGVFPINNFDLFQNFRFTSVTVTVSVSVSDNNNNTMSAELPNKCGPESTKDIYTRKTDFADGILEKVTDHTDQNKSDTVILNKKGQVLSNRAKRRLTKLEMIQKKVSKKEERRQKKLADPNADKNAGFDQDIFKETEYYFEKGLRKVYPYYYTFNAYAKRRWVGRRLLDVFAEEFRAEPKEFYEAAVGAGTLTVNGEKIESDYKLSDGDLIQNTIHRHENPVSGQEFKILHEDDDVLVVNKPSSIPCHPCGRYRFNSAVFILGKEMSRPNLRNIYRLDRLTSGVMVCGKTAKRTAELEKHVLKREVEKEYVCRVVGEFPDGQINIEEPLNCLSNRVAVWKVTANGKPSQTIFEKMSFNGETSVVKCYPKTGRTHQIRVHLQFLGYPIVNDPIYNSEAFGPLRGKGGDYGKSEQEVIKCIEETHNVGEWEDGENPLFDIKMAMKEKTLNKSECSFTRDSSRDENDSRGGHVGCHSNPENEQFDQITSKTTLDEPLAKRLKVTDSSGRSAFDLEKWIPDEGCKSCQRKYLDPSPSNLIMYLHALRYKGPDWDYQTELPEWAKDDFKEKTTT